MRRNIKLSATALTAALLGTACFSVTALASEDTDTFFKKLNYVKFLAAEADSCVESAFEETAAGTPVDLFWDYGGWSMQWKLLRAEDDGDTFRIRARYDETVLMPTDSGTEAGTELVMGELDETDTSQLWSLSELPDGTYAIVNEASGLVMSLQGDTTDDNTPICLAEADEDNLYRKWRVDVLEPEFVAPEIEIGASTLAVGDTTTIAPNGCTSVTYRSADEAIATVDENGLITAVGNGSTTIISDVVYTMPEDNDPELPLLEGEYAYSTQIIVGNEEQEGTSWQVASPNGTVKALFAQDPSSGSISYTVFHGDTAVLEAAPTGIVTSLGDFTEGLTFLSREDEVVEDSYELIGAKVKNVEAAANQSTLLFDKNGVTYGLVIRAYDNGIAFRYTVDQEGLSEPFQISAEKTGAKIPTGARVASAPYDLSNEGIPVVGELADLGGTYCMPMTWQATEDTYVLLSEADLNETYCGVAITGHSSGMLDIGFVPDQETDVVTEAPFKSSWRFAVVGTLSDITLNTMAETLNPPCAIEDTSWIQPGPMAWTWVNGDPCDDGETYKKYVDLAAEMGWKYLLLDEGWQPKDEAEYDDGGRHYKGYYDWTEELLQYAEEKGIGLIVWAHKCDLDDPEELSKIREWADMGFKGIKPDFFESTSQDTVKLVTTLIKTAAENEMLIDPHGVYIPSGERRTYPNMLTREAVSASEGRMNDAAYNCTLPYTRLAVGPADYAPMASFGNVYWEQYNSATLAHLTAEAIVFESGMQCLADKPEVYAESAAKDFYKDLPAEWDTSLLLDGEIGNYVNMARQSGENWYVGIMCNDPHDITLSLDFLEEGVTYTASIYKDGETKRDITAEEVTVTSQDTLEISTLQYGGAAIRFVPVD